MTTVTTPNGGTEAAVGLVTRLLDAGIEAAVVLAIGLAIYGVGRLLFVPAVGLVVDRANIEETFQLTAIRLTNAVFAVFAVYVAVTAAGLARTPTVTAAVAAAATIALGFAAQDVLGNLVSGAFIVIDPRVKVGDWIQWKDREGVIEDISFRVTRVHTFDNQLVSVPNSELTANAVTNPVAKKHVRISTAIGIGYGDDIAETQALLRTVADEQPAVLDRPRPTVQVTDLGASAVELTVRMWVADPSRADLLRIESAYVTAAKERLEAAGVELPYPYRQLTGEIGTRSIDDHQP